MLSFKAYNRNYRGKHNFMDEKERVYFCIDMKSFFASAECAERGLDPMQTPLVVADETRGRGALCLAVSPKLKSMGVKNRCRLFEIPGDIDFIIAKPRMKKYIEYAADIYDIYLDFFSPDDIHVYSIDECFLDATNYLSTYDVTPRAFAERLIEEIYTRKRIPATAGIGTNLYLAKIALDITAKKSSDGIGYLDEELYKRTLWEHTPITDFWQIARGTARRLRKRRIYTMKDVANYPEQGLYEEFGVNAELLIDHAFGREPCTIADIKAYKRKSSSVSFSQILFEDYSFEKAETVMREMVLNGCQEMMRRKVVTDRIGFYVGYSSDEVPSTGGSVKIAEHTSSFAVLLPYFTELFRKTTRKNTPIRRLVIDFGAVVSDEYENHGLLADAEKIAKEKSAETAVLDIKEKFGKNSILRGIDLKEEATAVKRNTLIGGHNGE